MPKYFLENGEFSDLLKDQLLEMLEQGDEDKIKLWKALFLINGKVHQWDKLKKDFQGEKIERPVPTQRLSVCSS